MSREIYETFGLGHLSISSINKWTGDRGAWVAHYIFGIKDEVGPAAWRGTAVEDGLTAHVTRSGVDPLTFALMTFDRECEGLETEEIEKERRLIEPMLQQAVGRWRESELGQPITQQVRVESWLEGILLPMRGYADFVLDGYCLDLKTTKALPSSPRHDHVLQAASYARARREGRATLLYVTAKKSALYEIDSDTIQSAIIDLTRRAHGLQNTLFAAFSRGSGNRDRARLALAEMCPPNLDSFYWSDAHFHRAQAQITAWQ